MLPPWVMPAGLLLSICLIVGGFLYLIYEVKAEARRSGASRERAESLAKGAKKLGEAARKKAKRKRRSGSDALKRL